MDSDQLALVARRSRAAALLTAGGAVIVILALGSSALELHHLQQDVVAVRQVKADLEHRKDDLAAQIEVLDKQLTQKKAEVAKLTPYALTGLGHRDTAEATPAVLETSLNAGQLAARLAQEGRDRRIDVIVRYYPKDIERDLNDGVVLPKLTSYGFRLEQGKPRTPFARTNSVWVGSAVQLDDVRLVVLTLIAAGVDIKGVREFREPTGQKSKVIEIGADAALADRAPVTAQAIMAASGFPRS